MYRVQYTPTVEGFATVTAAAVMFGSLLIKQTFSSLVDGVPKHVASGLILVVVGLMSVAQQPTIHRIAHCLGIKSHDT